MKNKLPCSILLAMCLPAWAETTLTQPESELNRQLDKIVPQTAPQSPEIAQPTLPNPSQITPPKQLTLADVQQQPALSEPLLNQALMMRDYTHAEQFLNIYRTWDKHDPILVDFAQGAIWRSQGKHAQAIALYRNILKQKPDLPTVRLDLSAMLFENQQIKESAEQFALAKQAGLPEDVLPRIAQYEQAIAQRNQWQISGGLSYQSDSNINNVSDAEAIRLPQFGNLLFQKDDDYLPKSGRGLSYNLSAQRDVNVSGNHYAVVGASVDGVSYWNQHDYDDITARAVLGYRYKNLQYDASILPFVEKRWYGGESYYTRSGVDMGASRWLSAKWRASVNGTLAWKHYANKRQGRDAQISTGATYLANNKTYFFGGVNYGRDKLHHAPSGSSKRIGAYVGWGQTWGKGLGTRLSVNRYNERYDGRHYIFTDTRRHDKVWAVNTAVWNQKLSFWGITPRLNWRYSKVKSNIDALHSYDKHRVFVDFEKSF